MIWGWFLRGAFYDPLAGGCRTPNPEPEPEPEGEFEGACPLMHAPPRAAKPSRKAGAEPPRGGGEGDGGTAPAPREGR